MKAVARIALFAAAIALSLFVAEGAARLLPSLPITSMGAVLRRDPLLDHSLRPFSRGRMKSREFDVEYRINSVGLRDDEPVEHAVLLLGDSFMEGYGVNRGSLVADLLRARGLPVVNAGVKSYSPLLEYLHLRHHGLALNPDTVVLFYDLSDPANDAFYAERLVTDDSGLPFAIAPRPFAFGFASNAALRWLDDHSVLYQQIVHAILKKSSTRESDPGFSGAAVSDLLLFAARDSEPDTTYYPRWKTSLGFLTLIRDTLRDRGIDFLLVAYPYGHQVSADAWKEGRRAHRFPAGVSSDRPLRYLEKWSAESGVRFLSLAPAFRTHPDPASLFFNFDGHWTPEGHAVAAEAVFKELRRPAAPPTSP